MAEAHSAVAFSFSVSPDGVNVNFNHELWRAVWASGVRSWRKRLGMVKNSYINSTFPVLPSSIVLAVLPTTTVYALQHKDIPLAFLDRVHEGLADGVYHAAAGVPLSLVDKVKHFPVLRLVSEPSRGYVSCVLTAAATWLAVVLGVRLLLRALLSYQGWMYESRGKKISFKTKAWMVAMKMMTGRKPLLYSYQGALPRLPVPALHDTMERYLRSVRPLKSDEDYNRLELLVRDFEKGLGPKLQRYLVLKSWWATNYVTDWWEEYVYLRGRAPIMINSNFYGLDAVFQHPTKNPAARGGNIIYSMLQFRRLEQREELKPIMLPSKVPLCSAQYVRQFNTTRVPGIDTDTLVHYSDSQWVVVYHKGRYFKMYLYNKGKLLLPIQIETMLQQILDDPSPPSPGEEHLAALTAADRIPWAKARQEYFKKGINKTSLDAIEKAAFMVVLDEEPQDFDMNDPTKFDRFGCSMLHGKGHDRWFDKSFNLIICSNGRIGMNAEHSWADAPIMAHMWEVNTGEDVALGYKDDGHCRGDLPFVPPNPVRLRWDITRQCEEVIEKSLATARQLIDDVDLHLMMFNAYGKGFIKKCNISPDAFIQMALQVAYYRDAGKFCLTYESSMTRLFREGRTETVRSCTIESCDFVRALENPAKTNKERVELMHKAAERHQDGYRNAMTGNGIDRHLFCLYVVSRYLNKDSPFLREVLSEPWRLSTSQTPHQQTDKLDLNKHPELISAGGGFGPVADDGYGVSYIIAGEDVIFFHISRKKTCGVTDAKRFGRNITQALQDMRKLFMEIGK